MCESKRKMLNDDFTEMANNNFSTAPILSVFNLLLTDENLKKALMRLKRVAFALSKGLLSGAGHDLLALKKLSEQVSELSVPDVTETEFLKQKKYYEAYLRIYASYGAHRIFQTSPKKHKNDAHDLDIMKYLSRGFSIVTAEKRWKKICAFAGLPVKHLFNSFEGRGISLIVNELIEANG